MIELKALSLRADYAFDVLLGQKTTEYRSWNTNYRGDLLICSTARKIKGCIEGHALCVVKIIDVFKFSDNTYAWKLEYMNPIKPFKVKGQQRMFNVDDKLIELPPMIKGKYETGDIPKSVENELAIWFDKTFEPLIYK